MRHCKADHHAREQYCHLQKCLTEELCSLWKGQKQCILPLQSSSDNCPLCMMHFFQKPSFIRLKAASPQCNGSSSSTVLFLLVSPARSDTFKDFKTWKACKAAKRTRARTKKKACSCTPDHCSDFPLQEVHCEECSVAVTFMLRSGVEKMLQAQQMRSFQDGS